jgi:hypothetical protein
VQFCVTSVFSVHQWKTEGRNHCSISRVTMQIHSNFNHQYPTKFHPSSANSSLTSTSVSPESAEKENRGTIVSNSFYKSIFGASRLLLQFKTMSKDEQLFIKRKDCNHCGCEWNSLLFFFIVKTCRKYGHSDRDGGTYLILFHLPTFNKESIVSVLFTSRKAKREKDTLIIVGYFTLRFILLIKT